MSKRGWVIDNLYGLVPNQADGTINGRPFYFRARHGHWRLHVAEVGGDPVGGEVIAEGDDDKAGWYTDEEHRAVLVAALEKVVTTLAQPTSGE